MVEYCGIPEESGQYTRLQLYVHEQPVIVFGRGSHDESLEEFLKSSEIPFATRDFEGRQVPVREGDHYRLAGTGVIIAEKEKMELSTPYGLSYTYLLLLDKELTALMLEQPPEGWSFEND